MQRRKVKGSARYFQSHKYTFSNIWKGDKQKTVPGILRFVSMRFLIFQKGISKKIYAGSFEMCEYALFNILKLDTQRNCARYFEIRKYAFFDIWKGDKQKSCSRFLEIPYYSFCYFETGYAKKRAMDFEIRQYAFF